MKKLPVEVGCIVISRAGRDAGRRFLVIRELDRDNVLIADGGLRTMDRPKKKKRMHLKPTGERCDDIAKRLSDGEAVLDHEIRKSLSTEEG